MSKFRKKPDVIDAFKWTADIDQTEDPEWAVAAIERGDIWFEDVPKPEAVEMRIRTLKGVMTARRGDYVIREVNGEIYPCKPGIFEATYEPAE
ncbi:hypothetical protein [Alicyclobacillus sp. ALC3]|uniref:hypothetical protein n=1 Tax=Alicyclobacillus sp. ALC3 TaxID=2796143 RepID=UPI002378A42D|nr:hypothetical protein [Alicyclobacillus sp. ALC3]WDL96915.1 hypothetical protein JC200_21990 [Alicyclobacillus sp. ALC3]